MESTVLLRNKIISVYEYVIETDQESKHNSFSDLQRTAICGEIKKCKKMKRFSFVKPTNN